MVTNTPTTNAERPPGSSCWTTTGLRDNKELTQCCEQRARARQNTITTATHTSTDRNIPTTFDPGCSSAVQFKGHYIILTISSALFLILLSAYYPRKYAGIFDAGARPNANTVSTDNQRPFTRIYTYILANLWAR